MLNLGSNTDTILYLSSSALQILALNNGSDEASCLAAEIREGPFWLTFSLILIACKNIERRLNEAKRKYKCHIGLN